MNIQLRSALRAYLAELLEAVSMAAVADDPGVSIDDLRDVERAALEAAGTVAMSVKALARRAGYKYNSYFHAAVKNLVGFGFLVRESGRVRRISTGS